MELRFSEDQILQIAQRYEDPYDLTLEELREPISLQGYLTKEQLKRVAYWKSPRGKHHIEKNSNEYVKEITTYALTSPVERVKIEVLTLLDGVSWPTASVILHWYDKAFYPILDFRALWSCSTDVPKRYKFAFWWQFVEFCREIASRNGIDKRELDRALWQYSKEYQSLR